MTEEPIEDLFARSGLPTWRRAVLTEAVRRAALSTLRIIGHAGAATAPMWASPPGPLDRPGEQAGEPAFQSLWNAR